MGLRHAKRKGAKGRKSLLPGVCGGAGVSYKINLCQRFIDTSRLIGQAKGAGVRVRWRGRGGYLRRFARPHALIPRPQSAAMVQARAV